MAQILVRIASAFVPRPTRARHLEEWRADLAGAHEVGISSMSVVIGAVVAVAFLGGVLPILQGVHGYTAGDQLGRPTYRD